MPYMIQELKEKDRILEQVQRWNLHFTLDDVKHADKLEIWGSSIQDPGDDYCEYRLCMPGGRIISERVKGW